MRTPHPPLSSIKKAISRSKDGVSFRAKHLRNLFAMKLAKQASAKDTSSVNGKTVPVPASPEHTTAPPPLVHASPRPTPERTAARPIKSHMPRWSSRRQNRKRMIAGTALIVCFHYWRTSTITETPIMMTANSNRLRKFRKWSLNQDPTDKSNIDRLSKRTISDYAADLDKMWLNYQDPNLILTRSLQTKNKRPTLFQVSENWKENVAVATGRMWDSYLDENTAIMENPNVNLDLRLENWKENVAVATGRMWDSYLDENTAIMENPNVNLDLRLGLGSKTLESAIDKTKALKRRAQNFVENDLQDKTKALKRRAQDFVESENVTEATGRMWNSYLDENSIIMENPEVNLDLGLDFGRKNLESVIDKTKGLKRKAHGFVENRIKVAAKNIKLNIKLRKENKKEKEEELAKASKACKEDEPIIMFSQWY